MNLLTLIRSRAAPGVWFPIAWAKRGARPLRRSGSCGRLDAGFSILAALCSQPERQNGNCARVFTCSGDRGQPRVRHLF